MFFQRGTNNNGNNVNVNTSLLTDYCDTCMITAGAWNKQLSLKFYPATGKDENGVTQYTTENNKIITTGITPDNAIVLCHGWEDKLLPIVNGTSEKMEDTVSVQIGVGENMKVFTIGFNKDKGGFLQMAWNVNETGITADENVLVFDFKPKTYITGYDYTTGASTEEVTVHAKLENFIARIYRVQDLLPTVAHSINYNRAVKAAYSKNNNENQSGGGYNSAPPLPAPIDDGSMNFLPFN